MNLLNRVLTIAALIALAVTLGVWLTGAQLTTVSPAAPAKIAPEPILAPPPALPTVTPIVAPVEVEISATAKSPATKTAESKPKSKPACQPRRGGLLRRR